LIYVQCTLTVLYTMYTNSTENPKNCFVHSCSLYCKLKLCCNRIHLYVNVIKYNSYNILRMNLVLNSFTLSPFDFRKSFLLTWSVYVIYVISVICFLIEWEDNVENRIYIRGEFIRKSVKRPFCCTVSILQVYFTYLCYITFWALEYHFIEILKLLLKKTKLWNRLVS